LSLSFGQFLYQTDGFRQNDDFKQDIYDAFAQYAFSSDLSIQFELKSEDVRAGDVPFRLNGFHQENLRQVIEQDTARVGGHYKIDPAQDFIVSAFYTTRKDSINNREFNQRPNPRNSFNLYSLNGSENKSFQTEMQYMFHPSSFDITTGVGYQNSKYDNLIESLATRASPPFDVSRNPNFTFSIPTQLETHYFNAYGYSKQNLLPGLTTVLGLSFDSYDDDLIDRQQLNPKFGVIWNPIKNLTLRSAAFRALKRPLAAGQTIEPTQIAGFNQFYDGNNGTTAWQYALGVDYNPIKPLFVGGEATWRKTSQPLISNDLLNHQNRNESSYLGYIYLTFTEWMSLKFEYRYERFSRDFISGNSDLTNPQSVETQQVPLSLNFFHPCGLFATLAGTYVNQQVESVRSDVGLDSESESFWTFDTSLGFRFPKRIGAISFEARNLLDNKFNYQSVFDASGPQLSPFIPERQLFVKLSLFY
jgi:opacity protein-like surface antigen